MTTTANTRDEAREMRAMVLLAIPYPPLPIVVQKIDEDNLIGSNTIATSHDLLSMLLAFHAPLNDAVASGVRQDTQRRVLTDFLVELARDETAWPPSLYATYCKYTRGHLQAYFPPDKDSGAVFMPLESVFKGDATHRRMCDYMAGQAVLLELDHGRAAQDWQHLEYVDMLMRAREWLVTLEKDDAQ